jgi:hypothetical protein
MSPRWGRLDRKVEAGVTAPKRLAGEAISPPAPGPSGRADGRGVGRARRVVALLVVVLAFYVVLIGARGISLLGDHRWVVKGLGVGVLLLPLVGIAIVVVELRFGSATERLSLLAADGESEVETAELDPDAAFELRKTQVEAAPQDWRAWYRLALAYGDARDTARGRRAMRRAIELERLRNSDGSTPLEGGS